MHVFLWYSFSFEPLAVSLVHSPSFSLTLTVSLSLRLPLSTSLHRIRSHCLRLAHSLVCARSFFSVAAFLFDRCMQYTRVRAIPYTIWRVVTGKLDVSCKWYDMSIVLTDFSSYTFIMNTCHMSHIPFSHSCRFFTRTHTHTSTRAWARAHTQHSHIHFFFVAPLFSRSFWHWCFPPIFFSIWVFCSISLHFYSFISSSIWFLLLIPGCWSHLLNQQSTYATAAPFSVNHYSIYLTLCSSQFPSPFQPRILCVVIFFHSILRFPIRHVHIYAILLLFSAVCSLYFRFQKKVEWDQATVYSVCCMRTVYAVRYVLFAICTAILFL